jgi:aminoglycoside phosphotransferase (APT) family kinase protein
MDELEVIAASDFGLEVATRLPITESFSSTVLSFIGVDGRHYVLKRHWARNKAVREMSSLRALDSHPEVPALLATSERDDVLTLLIEGFDGEPWADVDGAPSELLRALGRAMARIHAVSADSFDGRASWHELLTSNADVYVDVIGSEDVDLAQGARDVLHRNLALVPDPQTPCLVHFDLRPGNVLVRRDRLVGIIDFEACRGGHASMDLFKLWQQVPHGLPEIVHGYREVGEAEPWAELDSLAPLMQVYAAYHGLAGLAWCHTRSDFRGDFPAVNRGLIQRAVRVLA